MDIQSREKEAGIDIGYEFYQIIKDFDNPVQIFREAFQNSYDEGSTEVVCKVFIEKKLGSEDLFIDIRDNGNGLLKENIDCFFGLAKSTKINKDKQPVAGKIGYKGHGTKIFFNSESVEIISKTKNENSWYVKLDEPIKQLRETGKLKYTDFSKTDNAPFQLPDKYGTGFFVRIKNPYYFKTQHTRFLLNHLYLRDYTKWYTVFGNIKNIFTGKQSNVNLLLQGLNFENFKELYNNEHQIDPVSNIVKFYNNEYESIKMGHHFPEERFTDRDMKNYSSKIKQNKPYYDYYSRAIYKDRVYCDNNLYFDFVFYAEGYETKRRYDPLLSRRGKSTLSTNMIHTDAERYGLWACKGGVPIQKIDDWIEGGRGIGTYTYMHAFIDCDNFDLVANRGSMMNTDIEIQEIKKKKIKNIIKKKK